MKKKTTSILLSILSAIGIVGSSICFTQTIDGKLDYFSYTLNDYNFNNYQTGFVNPILRIQKKDTFTYNNLIQYFYYNFTTGNCREMINEDVDFVFDDGYELSTACVGQDVFSINSKVEEQEYIVERNMYHSYYKNEIFENGINHIARFDTTTFVFVSDSIANKIVERYNLFDHDEPYKEIITNEKYSKVTLKINGLVSPITCSINNILHSNKANGPRTTDLYGDFSLFYFNQTMASQMTSRFELDLKVDPYGNKQSFKVIKEMGYNTENSSFRFLKFNKKNNTYSESQKLNRNYVKIWNKDFDIVFIAIGVFLGILSLLIEFLFLRYFLFFENSITHLLYFCRLCLLVTYFIIAPFIYVYPWSSVVPVLVLIMMLFEALKIFEFLKSLKKKREGKISGDYYQIKI